MSRWSFGGSISTDRRSEEGSNSSFFDGGSNSSFFDGDGDCEDDDDLRAFIVLSQTKVQIAAQNNLCKV
jgi:hypothetical protein